MSISCCPYQIAVLHLISCRERCSWDEFEIIAQYCDTVSPDFILELGKVATVLKKAIWDSELNFTELDLIITSLLSPTSHPHKEPISHSMPSCSTTIPQEVLLV